MKLQLIQRLPSGQYKPPSKQYKSPRLFLAWGNLSKGVTSSGGHSIPMCKGIFCPLEFSSNVWHTPHYILKFTFACENQCN